MSIDGYIDISRPAALFGSPKLWDQFQLFIRKSPLPWFYGDHAYFGRFKFYRVTRCRYMHDGVSGRPDYDRLRRFGVDPKPWRKNGRHILICPPDRVFARLMGFDADEWIRDTVASLARATDRPIRMRGRLGAETRDRGLHADLVDCWALVTYTSNAAVEAIIAGVPAVVTGECAASAISISDPKLIETVECSEDRHTWAARLAANQWSLDEIASGECWRAIGKGNGI